MNGSERPRVVVGVCASVSGYQALRYAVAQARERRATLVVVRAFSARPPGDTSWRLAFTADAVAQVQAAFIEALGSMPKDLTIHVTAQEGTVGDVLVATANRPSDLLVIGGSRGHGLTGLRSGRIARRCARRACCPLVIVPVPALARAGRTARLERATTRAVEAYLRAPERTGTEPLRYEM